MATSRLSRPKRRQCQTVSSTIEERIHIDTLVDKISSIMLAINTDIYQLVSVRTTLNSIKETLIEADTNNSTIDNSLLHEINAVKEKLCNEGMNSLLNVVEKLVDSIAKSLPNRIS